MNFKNNEIVNEMVSIIGKFIYQTFWKIMNTYFHEDRRPIRQSECAIFNDNEIQNSQYH